MNRERNLSWRKAALAAMAMAGAIFGLAGCSSTPGTEAARAEARQHQAATLAPLMAQTAEQDFKTGNLKSALSNVQAALAGAPERPDYHVLHGRILIGLNRYQDAIAAFDRAIEIEPATGDAHYYKGLVYQFWSDNVKAYEAYEAAFRADETNADYLLAAVETLITMRDVHRANALIAENLGMFEHNATLRRAQGHAALLADDPKTAAECFHRAMILAPEDKSVVEELARAHFRAGDHAQCEHYLRSLFNDAAYAERQDLQHLLARCLTASGRIADARSLYLELVNDNPSDPQLWYELGSVAFELGDMRRVQNVISRTIAVWPDRFEGYVLRGMVHERDGRIDQAIVDYRRACERQRGEGEPYILLGLALQSQGRHAEAADAFAAARMIDPKNRQAQRLADLAEVTP